MAFVNFIKRLDRFGKSPELHFEGQSSFQTVFGAIVTILVYSLILVNTLNIVMDFINNDNQQEISRTTLESISELGE